MFLCPINATLVTRGNLHKMRSCPHWRWCCNNIQGAVADWDQRAIEWSKKTSYRHSPLCLHSRREGYNSAASVKIPVCHSVIKCNNLSCNLSWPNLELSFKTSSNTDVHVWQHKLEVNYEQVLCSSTVAHWRQGRRCSLKPASVHTNQRVQWRIL